MAPRKERDAAPPWTSGALLLALCACGGASASVTMTTPARLPLKTIPNVFLLSENFDAESLIPFVGEALQRSNVRVEFVDEVGVARLRQSAGMPALSALVSLRLDFRSGTATRARERRETFCGPRGCITRPRTDFVQVPTLSGVLTVRVLEGASGRALQQLVLRAESADGLVDVLQRDSVVRQLRIKLLAALDPQRRSLRVALRDFDLPGADDALDALRRGEWTQGRLDLERLKNLAESLPADERAALYYNLGVARRFDPESLAENEERHFEQAEAALQMAVRLDPQPLYAQALEDAVNHRNERRVLAAQEEAAGENFRVRQGADVLPPPPPPPPAYRESTP